ncbi:LysR family transcriptional regulator [Marinomonas ushuaiensis DSM 15871]|uniref:LysR family transcriptional regulator n=1 Tax=Marinomonas ushuaiensis DSM 15871 TaxID=1122207 RepID=X7E758_9GAMM|nr:LysR family transcriptional regulator [Marinomonas ushuaiensis]ETX11016.1 LysR family transcriptional regulator [Marinomonas ushuaiensis DSM 15871]
MSDFSFSAFCNWVKFRHLFLLDSLGRTKNMHLTAQQMNLSQPAVSKMLKEIETLLGFEVFERQTRSMVPTNLGEHVVRYAHTTLNESKNFVEHINSLHKGGYGYLKVGAIFAATSVVIPEAIIEIKQRFPLLNVELVEQTSGNLMTMLKENTLDLAIGRLAEQDQQQNFDFIPLAPENFCVVVNSSHPLCQEEVVSLDKLFDWPWLLYPKGTPIRNRMEESFSNAGVVLPQNIIVTISVNTFLELLQRGPMIGMLPTVMVKPHIESGMFTILQTPLDLAPQFYGILKRKNEELLGPALEFANILQYNAKQTLDAGNPLIDSI